MPRHRTPGELTPGQRRVLAALVAHIQAHGYAPSYRDLQAALGLASPRSVTRYLTALHTAGVVVYTPGIARGIALTPLGLEVAAGRS